MRVPHFDTTMLRLPQFKNDLNMSGTIGGGYFPVVSAAYSSVRRQQRVRKRKFRKWVSSGVFSFPCLCARLKNIEYLSQTAVNKIFLLI